jgi:hypothetical protein
LLTVTVSAGTAADGSSYPTLATIDGTGTASGGEGVVEVPALVNVESYAVVEGPEELILETHSPPQNFKRTLWGYNAAATAAPLHQYTIGPTGGAPVVQNATCVPTHTAGFAVSQNGRGVAFDPLDANLWNTHVNAVFIGDGFIHKNTPPPACTPVTSIPFHDGPGGTVQDDIGALDVDEATKHIWAAGYKPIALIGPPPALASFFYKVNRNTGEVIDSCWIPFRGGGVGNDTLAVFRSTKFPGSSKYFLTDAGEDNTVPNSLALIDQADCHDGLQVTPVAEFPKTNGMTGIDFEWPGLLSTNLFTFFNNGDAPFAASTPIGATNGLVEDISLCAFRAKFGGDGNDKCPYA